MPSAISDITGNSLDILSDAASEIDSLAAEVGINGPELRQELPPPGWLMTGRRVPVIHPNYQGTCSALLYINHTHSGLEWPLLRLHTFKHGGVLRQFNGLQWMRQCTLLQPAAGRVRMHRFSGANDSPEAEQAEREERHARLNQVYAQAEPLNAGHPWVRYRFAGHVGQDLLKRCAIRQTATGTLMAPITHPQEGRVGFHQISEFPQGATKRHYIKARGLLRGSAVVIRALDARARSSWPTLLCEGLATGLSLALGWPGRILVALNAGNLAPLRPQVSGPVVFCHDQDIWKPQVGNVGLDAALAAAHLGDRLQGPAFEAATLARCQPTDFNDLLCLEGPQALRRQLLDARQGV